MSARATSSLGGATREHTVILLHGWPQNARMWEPLVPELEQVFNVVAPDLRELERRGRGDVLFEAPAGDRGSGSA